MAKNSVVFVPALEDSVQLALRLKAQADEAKRDRVTDYTTDAAGEKALQALYRLIEVQADAAAGVVRLGGGVEND